MKTKICLIILIFLSGLQIIAQSSGIFDYRREESAAISWNGTNLFDARSLALADISLLSSNSFSQIQNPAWVPDNPGFSIGLNINIIGIQAFQYWGLNQGVFTSQLPLSKKLIQPGAAAFKFKLSKFTFTCGYRIGSLFTFPDFGNKQEDSIGSSYNLSGKFSGQDRLFFFSGAWKLSKKITGGAGLEYISGERKVDVSEVEVGFFWDKKSNRNVLKTITSSRMQDHNRNFIRLTLGTAYQFSDKFDIAAYIKIPFRGTADRKSSTGFENKYDAVKIEISDSFTDQSYLPMLISIGSILQVPLFQSELSLAFEADYRIWSNYHFYLFSEEIHRNMQNTICLKLGIEYPFLMGNLQEYFRLGFKIEQQPVRSPQGIFNALSFGTGILLGKFTVDLGFMYYFTTNLNHNQKHFTANTTISLSF
jgi:hypothetical protein